MQASIWPVPLHHHHACEGPLRRSVHRYSMHMHAHEVNTGGDAAACLSSSSAGCFTRKRSASSTFWLSSAITFRLDPQYHNTLMVNKMRCTHSTALRHDSSYSALAEAQQPQTIWNSPEYPSGSVCIMQTCRLDQLQPA